MKQRKSHKSKLKKRKKNIYPAGQTVFEIILATSPAPATLYLATCQTALPPPPFKNRLVCP